MTKQRLRDNFFIAMGAYASHKKETLDFDRWYEATTTTKYNADVKEIKNALSKKYNGEPE